ncbi:Mbov_0399 family ICE element protein [[Mycoplasma] gypis]|uniref:Uncharacterized protein n=1 Tax=[Mycoplasma] gypis TaxID=92404 RepID=A0ABZ2RR46_9BACT|nr:hypothetical protein [[Mycoplasma] gypis]MBN0919384.1 hypothetical protein [[Mycoplasma] gypis]
MNKTSKVLWLSTLPLITIPSMFLSYESVTNFKKTKWHTLNLKLFSQEELNAKLQEADKKIEEYSGTTITKTNSIYHSSEWWELGGGYWEEQEYYETVGVNKAQLKIWKEKKKEIENLININNQNSKFIGEYNKFISIVKEYLENDNTLSIPSDIGGVLTSNSLKNYKSNIDYLEEKIKQINNSINNPYFKLKFRVQDALNYINLYTEFNSSDVLVAENIAINLKLSQKYWNLDLSKRLKIEYGLWVDGYTNSTLLIKDVPQVIKKDKGFDSNLKLWDAGVYEVHTPLSVSFHTSDLENEALIINGKKIEVLNQEFNEILTDNRNFKQIKENSENENKTNKYVIEVKVFNDTFKSDNNLKYTYRITLIINQYQAVEDFKYYAWNPENNKQQKLLITEYKQDENGNNIIDENGKKVKNELYDAELDKNTGTKKKIVWLDFSTRNTAKELEWYQEKYKKEYPLTKATKIPVSTNTLFLPFAENETKKQGIVAEAINLGSGALLQLLSTTDEFKVFKIDAESENLKIIPFENGDYFKLLQNTTTDLSYFSKSGLYLFCSKINKSVDNFKLVYITDKQSSINSILDTLPRKWFGDIWKSYYGVLLKEYLTNERNLDENQINELKYEDIANYWYDYVKREHIREHYWNIKNISPKFDFSKLNNTNYNAFLNKYNNDYTKFKEDFLIKDKWSSYIKISKFVIDKLDNTIRILVSLDTNRQDLKLVNNDLIYKINFNTQNQSTTTEINIELNKELILKIAKASKEKDFFKKITKIKKSELFKTKKESDLDLFSYRLRYRKNLLDILLIGEDSVTILPTNSYTLYLENFLSKETDTKNIFETNNEEENKESETDTSDVNNEKLENSNSLFLSKERQFNINGLNDAEEIKKSIKNYLSQEFNNLVLNQDYQIKNLDEVVEQRKFIQIITDNNENKKYSILVLEALGNKSGRAFIKVYNYAKSYVDKEFDLNNIIGKKLVLNSKYLQEIKQMIINHINQLIDNENIQLDREIIIENFDKKINEIVLKRETTIVVIPNNVKVIGKLSFNVENTNASDIIENVNTNSIFKIDLNLVNVPTLTFSEKNNNKLRQKIIDEVRYVLNKKGLKENKHYEINSEELDKTMNFLNYSKKALLIVNNGSKSKNKLKIKIFNEVVANVFKQDANNDENNSFDLSLINSQKLVYKQNKASVLRQQIYFDIKDFLLEKYHLTEKENYVFEEDINSKVKKLIAQQGINNTTIVINSIKNKTINSYSFQIENFIENINNVIDDLEDIELQKEETDFSTIKLEDLTLSENTYSSIFNKIVLYIEENLDKLKLTDGIHYLIKRNELDNAIDELTYKLSYLNSTTLKVHSVRGFSKGVITLKIQNKLNYKFINDKTGNESLDGTLIKNKKFLFKQKQNKIILITVSVFLFFGIPLTVLLVALWKRKVARKV